jgi:DNA primase
MLAIAATRLGLIPHPATERSRWIVLVEGPPDMIAARSRAIPAVAVPGDHAWDPAWAPLLAGRHVAVIMDADPPGRDAAQRIASDLTPHAATVRIIDPAPDRDDGYDLTDWLHAHLTAAGSSALRQLARTRPAQPARTSGRLTRPTDPATPVTQPPAQPQATLAAAAAIPIGSEPFIHRHRGLVP